MKKIQIKLFATYNKNKQQQDVKNNVKLQTKWTKTTWKTFEETIRRGRNRSIKAWLVMDEDDDDDGDGDEL
jgi:rubrerythrin